MRDHRRITIGVVGTGAMGQGIAQLFAQAGHTIFCYDSSSEAVAKAIAAIRGQFDRQVEKGRMTADERSDATARLKPCTTLADLAPCGLVIEAIVENLEIKRSLFRDLEAIIAPEAILASNTSSLSITEIAAACAKPARVAGLHFFNPAPLMKIVEVIGAVRTAPDIVETLRAIVTHAGHRAVIVADQPGFLVNHAGRGLSTEGLRILEERVADSADIDDVLRDAAGFRMGPFELMDLTGLDVSAKVMTSVYEQFQQEPRFRPSSLVPPRVAAGLFGRKTGEGWRRYQPPQERTHRPAPPATLVKDLAFWIDPEAGAADAIAALVRAAGGRLTAVTEADVTIIQPWGLDATTYAARAGLDLARCVAIDPLPDFKTRRTLMLTVSTAPKARDGAHALFASDGVPVTIINDSPGFITQRVIATIVNIAANIAQRGIGSVADIEDAVKLGLGYPHGPLSWGDKIGGARILEILQGLLSVTNDPRYRPSPWIARRVAARLPLTTPEAARGE